MTSASRSSRALCLEHRVDLILHCGAYFKDESYYSWHHLVVTRALENQVYVLSLNRTGKGFVGSDFCPLWVDEDCPEYRFGEAEAFQRYEIDLQRIDTVRRTYTFLGDRLGDYAILPRRG